MIANNSFELYGQSSRKSKKDRFGPFVLILAMFLRSQSCYFDAIAHTGTPLGSQPYDFDVIAPTGP